MENKKIIIDVSLDQKGLEDKLVAVKTAIKGVSDQQKELKKQVDAGTISQSDYDEALAKSQIEADKLKVKQKGLNDELKLTETINTAAAGSYESLSAQAKLAELQLKKMADTLAVAEDGTIQTTEEYKKQADELAKLKQALIDYDLGVKNGKTSVGLYGDAIKEANKELIAAIATQKKQQEEAEKASEGVKNYAKSFSLFGVNVADAKEATGNFFKTLSTNPFLILVAGVVLLVNGIKELFNRFKETEEGAGKFGQITARLGAIFNALFDAVKPVFNFILGILEPIIDGALRLADAWSDLTSVFTGSKGELEKNAKAAAALDKEYRNITKAQRELTVENAKNQKEQEALKLIVEDTNKSLDERIAANQKSNQIELSGLNKTLDLEQRKLKNLEEQTKLLGDGNATEEQATAIAEQRVKVLEIQKESIGKQNELLVKQRELENEIATTLQNISKLSLEREILAGKVAEGSGEALDRRVKLIESGLADELKRYEGNALKQKELTLIAENEILGLKKDFNEKQAAAVKEATDKANEKRKETEEAKLNDLKLGLENELLATTAGTEEQFQARLALLAFNYEQEKKAAKQRFDELSEIDVKFYLQKEQLETEFTNQQNIRQAANLLAQRQRELQNQELTASEKLAKQEEINAAEEALKLLQVQNDENAEAERRAIREERALADAELVQEKYELGLEEEAAKLESELAREQIQYDERLALEVAYEENRRATLLAQRGLTAEQIERINRESDDRITKLKLANDKRKTDSENAMASARIDAANAIFDTLQTVAAGDEDLARTIFELKKGFTIAEIIQNGIAEIQGIAKANSVYPEPAATTIRTAKSIAAGVRTAGAVYKVASQKFADGGLLVGPSHAAGGIPIRLRNGGFVEAEGKEFIVNKESTAKHINLLKAINSDRRKFADGGILPNFATGAVDGLNIQNTVDVKMPAVQVAVQDINLAQQDYATLNDIGRLP
jgi:hypothetical protein